MNTAKHKTFYFSLNVSYFECQALYEGNQSTAILTEEKGRRVQVPVSSLKHLITSSGLKGRFRLSVDENHKFIEFVRV